MILLPGCRQPDSGKVIILSTGRMAGNAYPQEVKRNAPLQHYPYLAGYLKKVRAEAAADGDTVLLIDCGDSLSGSFAAYATGSMNMVELMNALQYDAIFLGNLDADVPSSALQALKIPVLCPFVTGEGQAALPQAPPAFRLEKDGIKIHLIANFYGTASAEQQPQRFPMWFGSVNLPVSTVRDYRPWQDNTPADLTLLNWMKFESGDVPAADEVKLIESVGADAILAHNIYSHQGHAVWQQQTYPQWPVPVSQNILRRNRGFTLSRLELTREGEQWIAVRPPELIQLTANTSEADPEIINRLSAFAPEIIKADEKLGNIESDISRQAFLDAYLYILRDHTDADVIVSSINSIRDHLEAGPLNASRLFNVLPWTNALETFTINREEYQKLAAIPELRILRRKELPERVQVVSSKFFSRLMARELGLDPQSIRSLGTGGEFDTLARHLKDRGLGILTVPTPAGDWVIEEPTP